jgi:hypothetical protein
MNKGEEKESTTTSTSEKTDQEDRCTLDVHTQQAGIAGGIPIMP